MKHLILVIILTAFIGCKDTKEQNAIQKTKTINQSVEVENIQLDDEALEVYKNTWTNEIKTNNGVKWQANIETNEGVERLQKSLKTQNTSTVDEYHKLAELLDSDKNYVIKNCTMKGDSHDNLHVWLLPLMAKIIALSETKTVEDASKIKQSIKENINEYNNYFY